VRNGNKLPPKGSFVYVQSKSMADEGLLFIGDWQSIVLRVLLVYGYGNWWPKKWLIVYGDWEPL